MKRLPTERLSGKHTKVEGGEGGRRRRQWHGTVTARYGQSACFFLLSFFLSLRCIFSFHICFSFLFHPFSEEDAAYAAFFFRGSVCILHSFLRVV